MIKKLSYLIFKILLLFDNFFKLITKRSFLVWFKDFFHESAYKELIIERKKIIFFIPNQLTEWRVNTFFSKEPETLEWIDGFEKKEKIVFWDIGANIGLYSIYNAIKNENSLTISFEPSTSNLRVLSRNISVNNLDEKIKIFPLAVSNNVNSFLKMNEPKFEEGAALNSFGETFDFEGKNFKTNMKYTTFGTTLNYLIESNILEVPNYIKIDVDGIEHLILDGAKNFLNNQKIKSLSVEINENFKDQYSKVIDIMNKNDFNILQKKSIYSLAKNNKFSKTFNYIFIR